MRKRKFTYLEPASIRPQGWLKKQLQLQAEGLCGHLDLVWPDIRDSKWIGGDREGWERVPYWLDGFIPLAWLLEDENLKARAKRYIDAILERQQEDGWICPCSMQERGSYDVWAVFLICKVLVGYEACSKDQRIEQAVYRALKQLLGHVSEKTLFGWGAARWFECLIPLLWLYERRQEEWILELCYVLEGCGIDYEKLYQNLSFDRPGAARYWTFLNHVVNVAMALKSRAEMSLVTGEDPNAFARKFYEKLTKKHGMAIGHFTGDECLSGTSPSQGSECCSITEAMYSYEELLSIGGDPFWGDLLEQTAYNGLAATISPDMWTHQYLQQTNQVECTIQPDECVPFNSNNGMAHNFGLEPHFGCCTANFNQGWPKFALSGVMEISGDNGAEGLAVTAIAPVEVKTQLKNVPVTLQVDTQYPFRDQVKLQVTVGAAGCMAAEQSAESRSVEFTLALRIPGFAKGAAITCGEEKWQARPGSFFTLRKLWQGTESVEITFDFEATFVKRPRGLTALRRGPLFYALPIAASYEKMEYEKDGVLRQFPYCDYQIRPQSEWAYGFAEKDITVIYDKIPEMPFDRSRPPVMLETKLAPLHWEMESGMCRPLPESLEPTGEKVIRRLQPYGCTTLRMTEMPMIEA